MTSTKTCGTCRLNLPTDRFYPSRTRGGLQGDCKSCRLEKKRMYDARKKAERQAATS